VSNELLIGSRNKKKAAELAEILKNLPWDVVDLSRFPDVPRPVEDGETFEDNAVAKALYYAEKCGLWCVADDSGLEVDALGGAPGIFSARYAGEDADDEANNAKLLEAMKDVPSEKRTARFVCCAAVAKLSGDVNIRTGTVEGHIAHKCKGKNGFGYDPLFIPCGYDQTFAQMNTATKNAISHRGLAFSKIRDHLASI